MEKVTIQATSREGIGVKGALSQIRAEKKVPAVVYGGHKDPASITVAVKDLEKIMKAGKNTLVEMTLNGEKELVLVKEVQFHAVTDNPIHADFQRVSMKEAVYLLKNYLEQNGCKKVVVSDLARDDMAECVEDAFRY